MKRSFGVGMGGGGGGRGMIKNVHGAIRAAVTIGGGGAEPPPISTTTNNNNRNQQQQPINTALSLSSSSSSNYNHPPPPALYAHEDSDWECIYEEDPHTLNHHDFGFGGVPSKDEVHHALSSLQRVVDSFSHDDDEYGYGINNKDKVISTPNKSRSGSGSGSDQLDWMEPSFQLCSNSSSSSTRVYDAFHLMHTDPSVQRMVIALSSDKAVWDAVMNNEVVRELRESIAEQDKVSIWEDNDEDDGCNPVKQVLGWMFVNTKDKVVELVERITKIVNDLVNNNKEEEEEPKRDDGISGSAADWFQEKLRSSFFLSIIVLFIVVVTRGTRTA